MADAGRTTTGASGREPQKQLWIRAPLGHTSKDTYGSLSAHQSPSVATISKCSASMLVTKSSWPLGKNWRSKATMSSGHLSS